MNGPVGGGQPPKPRQSWREQVRARADALNQVAGWMGDGARRAVQGFLDGARGATAGASYLPWARRARIERAFGQLDAAEAALLCRAEERYLRGLLPTVVTHVVAHLPPSNTRRRWVEELARVPPAALTEEHRAGLASAFTAASDAARREHKRLRSFRNIVIITSFALLLLAGGIAYVGAKQPAWIPLCFAPQTLDKVVCPTEETALPPAESGEGTGSPTGTVASEGTGLDDVVAETAQVQDIAVVMLLGLAAAAVTGAAALRRVRGSSTPFAVPVALILLKLPTGALTAVLGLVLLGGGFIPGFSALDSSGQILAWAVVFGAAQQLVTGLVDKKAQDVLDSVGSTPMTAEKE
jgi:hypothetical protein